MDNTGIHVILDCFDCDSKKLNDIKFIEGLLVDAALDSGMELRQVASEIFAPQGISSFVVVSESHLSCHTYPENSYCAIDVFTCGNHSKAKLAAQNIIKKLNCINYKEQILERG